MGRPAGQIDEKKREAILTAASDLFVEKGLLASMAEIARRAGVSKQTLYNRFPNRIDIARALAAKRAAEVTEPLRASGPVVDVLSALAEALLVRACAADGGQSLRAVALLSPELPEIAQALYTSGLGTSLDRLADWLAQQDRDGHLRVPSPRQAAEIFTGMVLGHSHLRSILGLPHPHLDDLKARAREAAHRFVRAYGVG
jgi:TetR/AcrR family transcriptional repressor of mexJK operon